VLPHIYFFFKGENPDLVDPQFNAMYEAAGAEQARLLMDYGLTGRDALCKKAADLFLRLLGYECGNLIARYKCKGGLFLLGGIVQRNARLIADNPALMEGILAKPRHIVKIIKDTPIYVVTYDKVGLLGALVFAKMLLHKLD
jgi:glucokinase